MYIHHFSRFGFCFRFACSTWGNTSHLIWRIRIRNDSDWRTGNRSYNWHHTACGLLTRASIDDHKHELQLNSMPAITSLERNAHCRDDYTFFWRVQICGTWPRRISASNKKWRVKIDKSDDGNACRGHLLSVVEFKCKRFLFFITFYCY